MNRAEALNYVPTGAGWPWTVRELMAERKPPEPPQKDFPRRGAEPQIRAPYAIAMWKAICEAKRPITRSAWFKRAAIPPGYERQLSNQAIKNLVNGKWVRKCAGGRYSKERQ